MYPIRSTGTYAREKYASRLEVQVHEIERDATLEITMNVAQRDLVADVADAEVAEARLCDRLVHGLVLLDAPQEVALSVLARHVLVVRVARGHLERDVRRDHRGVVAHGLEEDDDDALLLRHALLDLCAADRALSRRPVARGK